ncbi:MAG: hypothetical protein KDB31_09240 [Microthrixaceae bacterium]|nr:hypothetical protein [Microthrixaceae bacterium]
MASIEAHFAARMTDHYATAAANSLEQVERDLDEHHRMTPDDEPRS